MARSTPVTGCSPKTIDISNSRPSAPNLPGQMSIDELELALGAISEHHNRDGLIEWLNITELLLCRAKVLRQNAERLAIEWITANGAIDIGAIRYTVGHPKHVTCIDVIGCTHAAAAIDAWLAQWAKHYVSRQQGEEHVQPNEHQANAGSGASPQQQ